MNKKSDTNKEQKQSNKRSLNGVIRNKSKTSLVNPAIMKRPQFLAK